MAYKNYKVKNNINNERDIYTITVAGDFEGEPGQFYMLKNWSGTAPLLGRPLSVHDLRSGEIDFMYMDVGVGTHLMTGLEPGDDIALMGPLGVGFDLDEIKEKSRIAIVVGSVGIAPMEYLIKKIDVPADLYVGYRDHVVIPENLESRCDNIYISTEDGSVGHKGYIVDIFDDSDYDLVLSCGPCPMLEALYNKMTDKEKLRISMEAHMACGVGACMVCTCGRDGDYKRVCKDGPVMKGVDIFA